MKFDYQNQDVPLAYGRSIYRLWQIGRVFFVFRRRPQTPDLYQPHMVSASVSLDRLHFASVEVKHQNDVDSGARSTTVELELSQIYDKDKFLATLRQQIDRRRR